MGCWVWLSPYLNVYLVCVWASMTTSTIGARDELRQVRTWVGTCMRYPARKLSKQTTNHRRHSRLHIYTSPLYMCGFGAGQVKKMMAQYSSSHSAKQAFPLRDFVERFAHHFTCCIGPSQCIHLNGLPYVPLLPKKKLLILSGGQASCNGTHTCAAQQLTRDLTLWAESRRFGLQFQIAKHEWSLKWMEASFFHRQLIPSL